MSIRLQGPPAACIFRLAALAIATCLATPTIHAQAAPFAGMAPASAANLHYRYIGPVGNRVSSVAGVAGDPNVYYAGAASGGIWKTTDGGIHWAPIFDDQAVSSVGALAVAASNPNVVWAGTGEPWIRSHISIGNGVYKSTDAGRTWTHMGLDATGRIGRIVIDPSNPDVVFVAAQGHSYGPQQERGVYRTQDGGRTWTRVLFVDENTGAIDVVMHPANSQILFAAMWQLEMHTYGRESGGRGSGIFVSRDGGTTWTRLEGHGLPTHVIGKVGLAISRSNPNRVYALIETGDGNPLHGQPTDNGELWRSEDGGTSWHVVSYDRNLGCRQPYYTRMAVSPDNPDETYFLCATFSRSLDGGVTVTEGARGGGGGAGGRPRWRQGRRRRTRNGARTADDRAGRRQPRHVDRSDQPEPHGGRRRRRGADLDDASPRMAARAVADRTDLSRDGGHENSVLRVRQQAGRPVVPRPEQQQERRADRAQRVALGRRRRERMGNPRSRWTRISSGRPHPAREAAAASSSGSTSARARARTWRCGRSAPADTRQPTSSTASFGTHRSRFRRTTTTRSIPGASSCTRPPTAATRGT